MKPNELQEIADNYLLDDLNSLPIGLCKGKTGLVLFYLYYSRFTKNHWYESYAEELFNEICNEIHTELSTTFAHGLCGIGWAIEYMKSCNFLDNDNTDELLCEIDKKIMERDVRRITDISFDYGLEGIVAYVQSRIESKRQHVNPQIFNNCYINELQLACEQHGIEFNSPKYHVKNVWHKLITDKNTNIFSWKFKNAFLFFNNDHSSYSTMPVLNSKSILIFYRDSIGSRYGIGTYIKQLIECFNINEWDIHVIGLDVPNPQSTYHKDNGINYYEIPIWNHWNNNTNQTYARGVFYYLISRINSTTIYCHFNTKQYYELALYFKQKVHSKNVFTLHYMEWSFMIHGDFEKLDNILNNKFDPQNEYIIQSFEEEKKFMNNCCDKVIAIAHHSYNTLINLYNIPKEKLICIPNGIKDEFISQSSCLRQKSRKKYGFKPEDKIVIFAGRLDLVKGIVELIGCFHQIKLSIPNAQLLVIGDGDYRHAIGSAAPHWKDVIFTGFLNKKDLYELYSIADLGVVPSLHEEFGYVAIEMMMHRVPIIVNKTTGLKEITCNGKYGNLFKYTKTNRTDSLKKSILKALKKKKDEIYLDKVRDHILNNYSISSFRNNITELFNCI